MSRSRSALRRRLSGAPPVVRARRAARIAALKLAWAFASLVLLGSALAEWTQPHPSRFTFLFVVAWLAVSVWIFRAIRAERRAGHA